MFDGQVLTGWVIGGGGVVPCYGELTGGFDKGGTGDMNELTWFAFGFGAIVKRVRGLLIPFGIGLAYAP